MPISIIIPTLYIIIYNTYICLWRSRANIFTCCIWSLAFYVLSEFRSVGFVAWIEFVNSEHDEFLHEKIYGVGWPSPSFCLAGGLIAITIVHNVKLLEGFNFIHQRATKNLQIKVKEGLYKYKAWSWTFSKLRASKRRKWSDFKFQINTKLCTQCIEISHSYCSKFKHQFLTKKKDQSKP